ncbi:uncharacterized protein LOC141914971 isoform X2 [Tubulanus polymorphus]
MKTQISEAWMTSGEEAVNGRNIKSPSPKQVYKELQKFNIRPKSVPPHHFQQNLYEGSTKASRPHSAYPRAYHSPSDCERVFQVEHEPTRRQAFENHFPIKRQKSPQAWQKRAESPMVTFQEMPGYTISKNKEKIAMKINMEQFFNPPPKEVKIRNRMMNPASEALIAQLQQQVNDLSLYLEEERMTNKELTKKAEEALNNKVEEMKQQHTEEVSSLRESHASEVQQMKSDHEKQLAFQHNESEAVISKMRGEIGFLQGAFETYKSNLHQESTDRWKKLEKDLIQKQTLEMENAQMELMSRIAKERNNEKTQLIKEHSKTVETMEKEHKKEIDKLHRKFADATEDAAKLISVTAELENIKKDHTTLKTQYDSACSQLASLTRDLTDTKIRVLEFEQNFNVKVQQVDDKYHQKIESLMSQNAELRRLYRQKCEKLYDERHVNDKKLMARCQSAKDTMQRLIETRNRAQISVAAEDPNLSLQDKKAKHRPESAPITRAETREAKRAAGQLKDTAINPNFHAKGDFL